jgi:hypothetical protein
MSEPSYLTRFVTTSAQDILSGPPDPATLNAALRLLAKWRSQVIANTVAQRDGPILTHGPFAGMIYAVDAAEGAYTARRLGCYEASLAPIIETIIARAYPLVIDIGCAEGYYAVGLARRMPASQVMARDADPKAQVLCTTLATANHVADRIQIGGLITGADLDICTTQPTVIICDIEGAEGDLLNPATAPGLLHADILVEVHEAMHPGLLSTLTTRFDASHTITRIDRKLDDSALPAWMHGMSDLDRLLALWEWRSGPTPWLWMESKSAR